jgi:hypothetical protein
MWCYFFQRASDDDKSAKIKRYQQLQVNDFMSEQHPFETTSEKKQHLLALFTRLLPLVDSVADKLRFVFVLGLVSIVLVFLAL